MLLGALALTLLVFQSAPPVTAGGNDRTLWLYHTHTGKSGTFTFKHDGVYDQTVLQQMNLFLADWRTHEPTKMDPHLFDLLWEVYQEVGGKKPYNIVSSYRAPATNAMLRASSSGVAENSQHMLGKAMDVFIPGVPLDKLRAAAMHHQVGGVGYYPTSGSPFVHMDTGSVRAWPRMTRAQLKNVFPDGKTLHLPVDGTPLSDSGRQYAMAQWNKCHEVPCNGSLNLPPVDGGVVQVASADPAQHSVATIAVSAPAPAARPSFLDDGNLAVAALATMQSNLVAPVPATKSAAMMLATRSALPTDGGDALQALAEIGAPIPAARVLMTPTDSTALTAYAPESKPDEGAQRALQMLIERETTASIPAAIAAPNPVTRAAAIGTDAFAGLFEKTFESLRPGAPSNMGNALIGAIAQQDPVPSFAAPDFDLVAPEIDHVNETLVTPVAMSSSHFAELYEPEGFLAKTAELGPFANRVGLVSNLEAPPAYDAFSEDMSAIVVTY